MNNYLTSCSYLAFREGSSRDERSPEALDPAKLTLDGRRPEDFLVYARRYAKHLRYFHPGEEEGEAASWESFFSTGLLALAATIAAHDVEKTRREFSHLADLVQKEGKPGDFHDLARFVISQYQLVDEWHSAVRVDEHLVRVITVSIRSYLAEEMVRLTEMMAWWRKHTSGNDLQFFREGEISFLNRDEIWKPSGGIYGGKGPQSYAGEEQQRMIEDAMILSASFATVASVLDTLVSEARTWFKKDIFKGQDHPPHLALFVAFAHLFGFVQEQFNRLPERMIRFYYRDVLRISQGGPVPDEGFILFDPVKGFDPYFIGKGTAFTAGKDLLNRELMYKTTRDTVVTLTRVQVLRSVQIRKDGPLLLEYLNNFVTAGGDAKKDIEPPNRPFGGRQMGEKKDIGVAIASRQLYLSRGERKITITLFTRNNPAFDVYPASLFELQFTGETGWLSSSDPEKDKITITALARNDANGDGANRLTLRCTISIAQPSAIVGFDGKLHTGDYPVTLPVLQILLRLPGEPPMNGTPAEMAQYRDLVAKANDLQTLQLAAADITVEVGTINEKTNFDGVRDLKLENHEAPLDYKKPFFPFTALPKVGSSFYIGCADLIHKSVEKFTINIEWMVPDNFRTYYQRYFPPYDSNRQSASLDILYDRKWYGARSVELIDTLESNGRFNHFYVDMARVRAEAPGAQSNEVSKFETEKPNCTVKLKLLYPDFGHEIYPQLVTSVILEKAQRKSHEDYYQRIHDKLGDSISIKLPPDETIRDNRKNAWLSAVIYEGLKVADEERARISMTMGLSGIIAEFNKVETDLKKVDDDFKANRVIVNDDNFLARVVSFLKRLKLLNTRVSVDRDKQNVGNVADHLKDYLDKKVNHIIPSDRELSLLIVSQVNSVIDELSFRVVDELLAERKTKIPDGNKVLEVLRKAVDDANATINEAIAGKIAMLLSASEIPSKPYTPLINTLSVNYVSHKALHSGEDRFFQILPYGIAETAPLSPRRNLFPSTVLPVAKEAPSGMLFIGLSDCKAPQVLSLFFRLADGTKRNDRPTAPLQWWILRTDGWRLLKPEEVLSDGTFGLQATGIVLLSLPPDLSFSQTLFDREGLAWLCVSATGEVDAFPDLLDVQAQAAEVRFEDNDNDPQHLAEPLPPGKITRPMDGLPGIKKVMQSVATHNGKMAEAGQEYYTRVSERLRHKQRAISTWDYEHLVLEAFPLVYKVKCLSNYLAGRIAPGHVTIVPIANMVNAKNGGNAALLPRINFLDLQRIKEYLSQYTSPFVRLHVINPDIQYVQIKAVIKLKNEKDPGYYLKKLNQDIIEYLSPWATRGETHVFTAKAYPSSLYGFINRLDYIEYVSQMEMYQYSENATGDKIYQRWNTSQSLPETVLPNGHSIIVPSPEHEIKLL